MHRRSALCLALLALFLPATFMAEPPGPNLPGWQSPCYNCYNYACNLKTAYFAQPGGGTAITCAGVTAGAQADGLIKVVWSEGDPEPKCPEGHCLVALAIDSDSSGPWVGPDYHWYRLNGDGTWSQKHGGQPAIGVGDDGNPLDPQSPASRGDYETFCGYFCVPQDPSPTLSGDLAWFPYPGTITIFDFAVSGLEPERIMLRRPRDLAAVEKRLPTFRLAPDPHWQEQGAFRSYAVIGDPELGFPAMLHVAKGIVAVYSELENPEIKYYYDDRGLGAYLAEWFTNPDDAVVKPGDDAVVEPEPEPWAKDDRNDAAEDSDDGFALPVHGGSGWPPLMLGSLLLLTALCWLPRIERRFVPVALALGALVLLPATEASANRWNVKKGVKVKANEKVTVTVKFTKDGNVIKTDSETFENGSANPLIFQYQSNAPKDTNCKSEKCVREPLGRGADGRTLAPIISQLDAVATLATIPICLWLELLGYIGDFAFENPLFSAASGVEDLYAGVVWEEYLGMPVPQVGEIFYVGPDGRSPDLPGYLFSRVPLEFVPGEGFLTQEPFSGAVEVTVIDSQSLPIPTDVEPGELKPLDFTTVD